MLVEKVEDNIQKNMDKAKDIVDNINQHNSHLEHK